MSETSPFENLSRQRVSDLFQKVGEICAVVNQARGGREILETSLTMTLSLFGARRGSVFIVDERREQLVCQASVGLATEEREGLVKKLGGGGVVAQVAARKVPLVVEDISRDDRFVQYKPRSSYETPSFICAPLLLKDKLLGVINIADKIDGRSFSTEELQVLDFLATQIALNYHRIELYNKFKRIVRQSQTLKDELGKSSQEADHLKKQVVVQEKLASLGKLAGGIAHEFNNPLDGVMRYTNLSLELVGNSDEVLRGYLIEIRQGLNRMANIVKSLLACSRQASPSLQKIEPIRAVDSAVQSLGPLLAAKRVSLKKEVASDIPAVFDLGLEMITVNLLRNAIDAVEEGGEIHLALQETGESLILSVTDNGCGIPEEKIQDIFEPFYTTKDIEKGCGLGLTIVSEIVKNYNGKIDVVSEVGRGTTFIVTLFRHTMNSDG